MNRSKTINNNKIREVDHSITKMIFITTFFQNLFDYSKSSRLTSSKFL